MANLPHPAGSLVGRSDDIRGVRAALDRARLVNLVGPGGVGKTALAAEVLDELEPEFDRVALVELAEATRGADVYRLLANEVLEDGDGDLDRLAASLTATPTLLVLDNCEHMVEEIASVVSALLGATGELTVLATSRRPLGLSAEVTWPVEPLTIPEDHRSDEDLISTGSVQLFLERVRQSVPTFELTDANRSLVAAICTAADGVPLVLELAAALVRGRSLDEILSAMTDRPAGLGATRRDRADHQQSLAASLDWSRRFLSDDDARLLNRLAVFVGGFTARSVRHLDGMDGLDGADTVDGLSRLVDHSLIGFDHIEGRYRMLEVVRLDALDRLSDDERREVELAHLSACREIVAALADGMYEADPENRFPRFVFELPNLCAALRRSYNDEDLDAFRSLLGPIAVWMVHYVAPEHPKVWHEAFERDSVPTTWRAGVQTAIAFYWSHRGRADLALEHATAGAALHREADDGTGLAIALNAAANARLSLGDRVTATDTYRQALDVAIQARSVYGELVVRVSLARLDPTGDEALAHLTAARPLAAGGFAAIEAAVITGLGRHALHGARALDRPTGSEVDEVNGTAAVDAARRLCDEATDLARRLGYPEVVAEALCGRATVAAFEGDVDRAESLYREALTIGRRRVHQGVIDQATTGLAGLRPTNDQGTGTAGSKNGHDTAIADRVDRGEGTTVHRDLTETGDVAPIELSDRELSVARLLRGDLTQREIADELYIAPSTVKTHIKSIYRKLGVTKRSYAITRAAELGLFDS